MSKRVTPFNLICCCIAAIVIPFFIACKKEPANYRKNFVGDFDFVVTTSCWTLNNGPSTPRTITFTGKITHEAGFEKDKRNLINIPIDESSVKTFQITKEGTLFIICGVTTAGEPVVYEVGKFEETDRLEMQIGDVCSQSKGGGCGVRVVGTRIK